MESKYDEYVTRESVNILIEKYESQLTEKDKEIFNKDVAHQTTQDLWTKTINENTKLKQDNKTLSDAFNLLNKNYGIMVDDIERLKKRCKYIKREGESCTLNNDCKYPNCL